MNDSEKIKMNLNIGDQRITLTVPVARKEFARNVESDVDKLYRKWRQAFPKKTDREIFAMVAYQYATFYGELKELYDSAAVKAADCLRQLDNESDPEDKDPDSDSEGMEYSY
jgi:hypothetical protein